MGTGVLRPQDKHLLYYSESVSLGIPHPHNPELKKAAGQAPGPSLRVKGGGRRLGTAAEVTLQGKVVRWGEGVQGVVGKMLHL